MLKIFYRVYSNSKDASYLFSVKKDSNLKTSCHVKTKTSLWTKLLENLLLAECLISTYPCYGCSFVAKLAKLNWKKKFFFWKNIFLYKIYIIYRKKHFIWKKVLYLNFFLPKKTFFLEKNIYENIENIYLIWKIFIYAENVCVTNKI